MRTKYRDSFYQAPSSANVINEKKKLIDRVTKLFALANSTSHPEEAESARKMAVKLLADHNISIGQLEKDEKYVIITEQFSVRNFNYTKFLYYAIANFTGVAFFLAGARFRYVGTKSNIEAFRYMLCIVLEQRDRAWSAARTPGTRKQRWMLGFTWGVQDKCRELMKQTTEEVQERGMVPVNEKQNAYNWFTQGRKINRTHLETTPYSEEGREAGRQVSLNKGVGHTPATTKQIGA